MLLYFYMLKMCFTHSISLGLLWFFWHVCHCLLILCFIHDMLFCIQSKNVFYYFCLMNLHWCKTICHVQNAQYTSCILGWLFFLIYLFLLLYQKKKKKSYTEHSIRNWHMIWGIPNGHYERTLHTIFKLYHWDNPITSVMTLPAVMWLKKNI